MEVIIKEMFTPRLTIAKDRVTLKIPTRFSEEDKEMLKKFSEQVVVGLGTVELTHRGIFRKDEAYTQFRRIVMHTGHYKGSWKNKEFIYHE